MRHKDRRLRDWQGEFGDARWWAQSLAFAAVAGVVLGVLGPFGSFLNGNLLLRIFSWVVNLVVGTVFIGLAVPLLTRLALRLRLARRFGIVAGVLVATLPVTLFSYAFGHWLWPQAINRVRPEDWVSQALIIEAAVLGLWVLFQLALEARPTSSRPPEAAAPPAIDADVLCLQMEDHYVRIHRLHGSGLELMTMSDAIARYGPQGLRVHRSWWVADHAVTAAERDGRNWRLRLSNGLSVPVARTSVTEVRARGWL